MYLFQPTGDRHDPTAFELRPFQPPPARDPHASDTPRTGLDGEVEGNASTMNSSAQPGEAAHRPAIDRAYSIFEGSELPALRAIRPSVSARVRVSCGQPAHVQSAITQGDVVMVSGPWRTTGHWWSEEERYAKDHFDVQMSDGLVIRLCFDWMERVWQIDGIYD